MWRWAGLPFVFGTCSFALEGIALVLPVKADMARPHMFGQLLIMVMVIILLTFITYPPRWSGLVLMHVFVSPLSQVHI
jgi:hypothetical protein